MIGGGEKDDIVSLIEIFVIERCISLFRKEEVSDPRSEQGATLPLLDKSWWLFTKVVLSKKPTKLIPTLAI